MKSNAIRAAVAASIPALLIGLTTYLTLHRKPHVAYAQTPVYMVNGSPTIQMSGSAASGRLASNIALLSAGGTIRLTSTYTETITSAITVSTAGVHILCDKGATLTSGTTRMFNANGDNFELGGCNVSGATQQTMVFNGAAPYIHDNVFQQGGSTGGLTPAATLDLEGSTTNDARIENNTFTNNGTGAGTDSYVIATNYSSNNSTSRIHIRNNRFFANNAAFVIQPFNISDSDISGNYIDQNNILGTSNTASGYGINPYNTSTASAPMPRLNIYGNNVTNTAGTSIYCQGCSYSTISNNLLTNCAQQQLATVLTVGCIGISAGNAMSPTTPGMVITGNTLHGSTEHGIETSHSTGVNISGNAMDGIAKNAIYVSGNSDTKPVITGNNIISTGVTPASGIVVLATTDALITSNYVANPFNFGIETDATSLRATVMGNYVGGANNAGSVSIYLQAANSSAVGNTVYLNSLGAPGIRIAQTSSRASQNYVVVAATGSSPLFVSSNCSACIVEQNVVYFASGTGTGITEAAGAVNDVFRRNTVVGGSSPGWTLGGTTPTQYENSYNGAISATQVTTLTIGANTVLPATLTGSQGNGALVSTATGPFTNGNLRSTNAGGADADSGLIVNRMTTQMVACGTTTACGNGIPTAPRVVFGQAALTAGTATVTGISPAFTSTTTSMCACSDLSGTPNACQAIPASTSSITLKGTGTDTISYVCAGN